MRIKSMLKTLIGIVIILALLLLFAVMIGVWFEVLTLNIVEIAGEDNLWIHIFEYDYFFSQSDIHSIFTNLDFTNLDWLYYIIAGFILLLALQSVYDVLMCTTGSNKKAFNSVHTLGYFQRNRYADEDDEEEDDEEDDEEEDDEDAEDEDDFV